MAAAALTLGLAGCALPPAAETAASPPAVSLGERPAALARPLAEAAPLDLDRWWTRLGDDRLAAIVDEALANNLDARIAVARIAEARAAVALAGAGAQPTVGASAEVDALRLSENGLQPVRLLGSRDQVLHQAGVAASWEWDVFGRVQHGVAAAGAQAEALAADADGVKLAVAAEAARMFLGWRAQRAELAAREAQVAMLQQLDGVVAARIAAGDLAAAERAPSLARLRSADAALPGLQARARDSLLALGTLMGGLPERLLAMEAEAAAPVPTWPELPVGQRADILARRPDVRAAAQRLTALRAERALTDSERFPRLALSASGAFQSLALGNLFAAGSQALALTPLIQWQVADGGRVQARIAAADARVEAAALAYERTVLLAVGEAERTLEAYRRSREQAVAQHAVTAQLAAVGDMQRRRLEAGDIARAEWLDAERQRLDATEAEARTQAQTAQALAAAVKALGGGWTAGAPSAR